MVRIAMAPHHDSSTADNVCSGVDPKTEKIMSLDIDRATSTSTGSGGGIGILGLLLVLFIGLKLGKVITWSWWWVMAPMWVPAALSLAAMVIIVPFLLKKLK